MNLGRSGNPTLNDKSFQISESTYGDNRMTLNGTVNKTGMLLLLIIGSAYYSWTHAEQMMPLLGVGAIVGFILALVTMFKPQWAGITVPLYGIAEGLFLGGISLMFEYKFPGIVMRAVGLTFGVFISLLLAYRSGMIKPTENFKLMIASATGGIAVVYLVSFVMSFFGMRLNFLYDSSPLSIGISLFVVGIAALNLVLDFDFIENGAERGAPKYMEWYGAFGLAVTLIWLYLEILRLLAKLQSRD